MDSDRRPRRNGHWITIRFEPAELNGSIDDHPFDRIRPDDALQGWHVPLGTLAEYAFGQAFVPGGRGSRTK